MSVRLFIHTFTLEGCLSGVSACVCESVCACVCPHLPFFFSVCLCSRACGRRICVCVCVLSNIVTLVYAASVCLQLSHCDRERKREVEYRESDNTKE